MTKDNHLIGKFDLSGIPPLPRGQPQIEVTFDINADGILKVSAVEKSTGKTEHIICSEAKNKLSEDDIQKMVQDAEKFKAADQEVKAKVEAKNQLENYCFTIKN